MILVLGASGFVGSTVCRLLQRRGRPFVGVAHKDGPDLEDRAATLEAFRRIRPEKIINCAAFVGGIRYGYKRPVDLFEKNALMTVNILRAADDVKVKRLVNPISNCAYPARAELFREEEFWDGPLHESVLVYGFIRKAMWVGSWAYHREHGLDVMNLIVSNMYGPGDHFDPERSHAIGALVRRFFDAKRASTPEVVVWGSGRPVREWLYVEDGAEALVRGLDCAPSEPPVNVGVASGISVAELAEKIAKVVGYTGRIVYDASQPDGAPYKTVDGSKGAKLLGWTPKITLDEGIARTVDWYAANGIASI
jgi:GDP-L-fucose synthase